jgi:hypothetical protein
VYTELSVYSREEATFTLAYSNTGGYESWSSIKNRFPPEAPFVRSDPPPTLGETGDLEVTWEFPEGLPSGIRGEITVTVLIGPDLPPSTTIEIWDGIYNHVGELADETVIAYHVPPPTWEKWVNGQPWNLGFGVPVQTSDTITVTDVISTRSSIAIVEHWDSERLTLVDYATEPSAGIILSETGFLSWEFPELEDTPDTVTITKWFHVEPCTWTYTVLWEELWVEGIEWERRPVHVDKIPPDLRLAGIGGGEVYAGDLAMFTLLYSNTGGYENDAWITNTFPIVAPFVSASLTPTRVADDGAWAAWRLGDLETGEEGIIDVTVAISDALIPGNWITITGWIYNHVGEPVDEATIKLHVACKELARVTLTYTNTGAIYTDTVVYFEANLAPDDADKPYTYTIDYGEGAGPGAPATSSADPFGFTHTFPITGSYTVTFAAWNCAMTTPESDSVSYTVYGYGGGHVIYLPVVMRNF